MRVSEERVDHLLNYCDEHGIEIRSKDDSAKNWYHAFILWLGTIFVTDFMVRFGTTIQKAIYMPSGEGIDKESLQRPALYCLIRHEIIHAIDYARHPIWYKVTYVILLPALFTMRAFWERRGYTAGLVARDELGYMLDEYATADWLSRVFTSSNYFWMAIGKKSEYEFWLERTRTVKFTDHYSGFYPYDDKYQAHFEGAG